MVKKEEVLLNTTNTTISPFSNAIVNRNSTTDAYPTNAPVASPTNALVPASHSTPIDQVLAPQPKEGRNFEAWEPKGWWE